MPIQLYRAMIKGCFSITPSSPHTHRAIIRVNGKMQVMASDRVRISIRVRFSLGLGLVEKSLWLVDGNN